MDSTTELNIYKSTDDYDKYLDKYYKPFLSEVGGILLTIFNYFYYNYWKLLDQEKFYLFQERLIGVKQNKIC